MLRASAPTTIWYCSVSLLAVTITRSPADVLVVLLRKTSMSPPENLPGAYRNPIGSNSSRRDFRKGDTWMLMSGAREYLVLQLYLIWTCQVVSATCGTNEMLVDSYEAVSGTNLDWLNVEDAQIGTVLSTTSVQACRRLTEMGSSTSACGAAPGHWSSNSTSTHPSRSRKRIECIQRDGLMLGRMLHGLPYPRRCVLYCQA